MKKRILIAALSLFVSTTLFSTSTSINAIENISSDNTYTEYFDDGSYIVVTITESETQSRSSTKDGTKTSTYYGANGDICWTYSVNGSFSYNGTSSSCTSVSDSYSIKNSSWHIDSHSCSRSGNTAYGNVTMDYKFIGITTKSVSDSVTLVCSPNGSLS